MPDHNEIRALDWKDLPLLYRLRERGLCLDSQQAYTRGANPLQAALLHAVTPGRGDCTLVAPHPTEPALTAIAQARHHPRAPIARLTFLGPAASIDEDNGFRLLEAIASAIGKRGGHHLLAEVNEDAQAFESLRRAGFAVYARQRIWQLPAQSGSPAEPADGAWRDERAEDRLAIHRLYLNVVPGLVQQVEPPPGGPPAGLVHRQQGEMQAFLDLAAGPRGGWIQPYVHPAAEGHEALLAESFRRLAGRQKRPLYICIRSYQGWMNAALERLGLARCADQAVMVKRMTAPVRQSQEVFAPQLEATRPEPTAPFAPSRRTEPIAGVDNKTS